MNIEELRSEFEKLPIIADLISKGGYWCFDNDCYDADINAEITLNELGFMDGAWFMFRELRR